MKARFFIVYLRKITIMEKISVFVSDETFKYLEDKKKAVGSSITFEANALIEFAIKEKTRKKKSNAKEDHSQHNSAD